MIPVIASGGTAFLLANEISAVITLTLRSRFQNPVSFGNFSSLPFTFRLCWKLSHLLMEVYMFINIYADINVCKYDICLYTETHMCVCMVMHSYCWGYVLRNASLATFIAGQTS